MTEEKENTKIELENIKLREALEEIAADYKTYIGHGDYNEGPLPALDLQAIARKTLIELENND